MEDHRHESPTFLRIAAILLRLGQKASKEKPRHPWRLQVARVSATMFGGNSTATGEKNKPPIIYGDWPDGRFCKVCEDALTRFSGILQEPVHKLLGMEHLTIEQQIRSEIYRAFALLGADHELLAVVGSWGDTLNDEEILTFFKGWNAGEAKRVVEALQWNASRQSGNRQRRRKGGKLLAFPKAVDSGA